MKIKKECMKRMIPLFLLTCMIALLAACGSDSAESSSDSEISDILDTDFQSETESKTEEADTSEEDGEGVTDSDSISSADSNILHFSQQRHWFQR